MDNYCVSETYCVGSVNELLTTTVSVKPAESGHFMCYGQLLYQWSLLSWRHLMRYGQLLCQWNLLDWGHLTRYRHLQRQWNFLSWGNLHIWGHLQSWKRGTRWCSLLKHSATTREVAGWIPYGVIGIYHWLNPSGRIMALGSTQTLTAIFTRCILCR